MEHGTEAERGMLKPKVLTEVLNQAATNGVKGALLFNNAGSLLAFAGSDPQGTEAVAAIVSNIWTSFETSAETEIMLLEQERGRIAVTKVTNGLLLCLFTDLSVEFGLLKAKTQTLQRYLEQPLSQLIFDSI